MAVSYSQLLHNVGLRMNALVGAQFGVLETTYATATLTSANFKSADWPFSSFRDAILMAVGQYAKAIASVANHPDRVALADVTASLADGGLIPATGSGGSTIIGVYGEVVDASDGHQLTEAPLEVIRRYKAETWRTYPLYNFKIIGRRIFHTRTNVIIGVCTYSRTAQLTAWNAAGNMPLPDNYEMGVTALAIALMTRNKAHETQAVAYATYAAADLANIAKGLTSTPSAALPSPTMASTAS